MSRPEEIRIALESDEDDLPVECFISREELSDLLTELAAYKKAKAENDERFMIERDEARAKLDIAVDRLQAIKNCGSEYQCGHCQKLASNALVQIQVGKPEGNTSD